MQGWKEKLLSQADKEIMIKAVIQSILAYSMSVFKLPRCLCKDIEAMIQKFWWDQGEARKIHWVKWSTLCTSKLVGGMGFKDFQMFNSALLAKHEKDSLVYKVFQAKFFPGGSIFDAVIPSRCSHAWRSILQARDVILKGVVWRVGDGRSINIWEQKWVPNLITSKVVSPRSNSHVIWVSELFLPNSKLWDVELLNAIFYLWEAEEISRIHVSPHCQIDAYVWLFTSNGDYSVKSAYKMLATKAMASAQAYSLIDNSEKVWKGVWRIRTPNKIRHFMWRAVKDSLPTIENLHKRQIPLDKSCSLCEEYQETNMHVLWLCD